MAMTFAWATGVSAQTAANAAQDSSASARRTAPASAADAPKVLPGGIRIGATVSLLPFNVLPNEEYHTTTSVPVSSTVVASESTSPPAGGGVSIEIPIRGRFAFQTGFLFRSASYTAGTESVTGEDDDDTEEDDRVFTSSIERTRAQYWDVPLILRVYDSADRAKRFRAFFQTGAAIRRAANIETVREATASDGSVTRDTTPASARNRTIYGGVIGAGMQFATTGRLALVPELRYTRWTSPTFDSGPTRSTRNQLEVLFSITF